MSLQLCILILVLFSVVADDKTSWEKHHRIYKRHVTCGELQFRCKTAGWCIHYEWMCDTEADCPDRSDEDNCPSDCRGEHQFRCDNGQCISRQYRCDGENDCLDYTDEKHCDEKKCSLGEIQCDNKQCIEDSWLCDGDDDCGDGWDEKNCRTDPWNSVDYEDNNNYNQNWNSMVSDVVSCLSGLR